MVVSTYQYYFNPLYAREDLRSTAQRIRSQPEIPVLTSSSITSHFIRYYGIGSKQTVVPFSSTSIIEESDHPRLFLVWNRIWTLDNVGYYQKYFKEHYRVIEEDRFPGVSVQLVEKKRANYE